MTQPNCEKMLFVLVSRLRIACRKAGLTSIRDVAKASKVSKSGIDRIWRLEHYPTADTIAAICQAAGTVPVMMFCKVKAEEVNRRWKQKGIEPGWYPQQEESQQAQQPEPKPEPAKPEPKPEPAPAAEPVKTEPRSILDILHGMRPE